MNKEFIKIKYNISKIKSKLDFNQISYEDAKTETEQLIVKLNKEGEKIAKKHGVKFNKFTFQGLMR